MLYRYSGIYSASDEASCTAMAANPRMARKASKTVKVTAGTLPMPKRRSPRTAGVSKSSLHRVFGRDNSAGVARCQGEIQRGWSWCARR